MSTAVFVCDLLGNELFYQLVTEYFYLLHKGKKEILFFNIVFLNNASEMNMKGCESLDLKKN